MPEPEPDTATLRAVFDTVIPPDAWPGGWEGGVGGLLEAEGSGDLAWARDALARAAAALDAEAAVRFGSRFATLDADARELVFAELVQRPGTQPDLSAAIRVGFEGFYAGGSEPVGWDMVGYRAVPDGVSPVEPDLLASIEPGQIRPSYDVIVIGGGAGGGVAAAVLAERGATVLLVERAPARRNGELRGDHLRGKRTAVYSCVVGPGSGHPRVIEQLDGSEQVLAATGDAFAWGLTAICLGGGTRVWQGMAYRFLPEDFAMASTYGTPEGSTLADWPFGYDELAPYYDRVEWELGVSGDSAGPIAARSQRARPYPMGPLPDTPMRAAFAEAADRLGWGAGPIPFAINSERRAGRAACVACPQCCGHACPVDAKNGTHNTFVPRALATGRCDVIMAAQAVEIVHDGRGCAESVTMVIDSDDEVLRRTVPCAAVVVAAGAVETPRLILVSGLGNEWVGRNHHSHSVAMVFAHDAPPLQRFEGPGHSIGTLDFVHRNGEAWGGGVVFDMPLPLPLTAAQMAPAFGGPTFGLSHKRWMRERQAHLVGAMGIGQEIPSALSTVGLDASVADRHGMPVARLVRRRHRATDEVARYMAEHGERWLTALGIERVLAIPVLASPPADEHSAGTCRMGESAGSSACDAEGRIHGTVNVYVADASLHTTNGSVNPGLTVMANAYRVADRLASRR